MNKVQISNNFFVPMPVVLLGTQVDGKNNFMAVGWCTRTEMNPPMILCGVGNRHYTAKGILEAGSFSVNLPSASLLEKTDYCGIASGAKVDKSKMFDVFYGALKTAPMISECPVAMECKLVKTVPLEATTIFVGEIVGVYADEQVLAEGKPDFAAIDPLFLTMPDNRYWKLGTHAGDAWKAGKNYQP